MGFAIATMAAQRGAEVTLITGPTHMMTPRNMVVVHIRTAEEMRQAVITRVADQDAVIMAAAVADYRPKQAAQQKIKKGTSSLALDMERTTDILTEIAATRPPVLVGFAVETNDGLTYARKKLIEKNLDLIVFNDVTVEGAGFDVDTNIVTLLHRDGREESFPKQPKSEVADLVLNEVAALLITRKTISS